MSRHRCYHVWLGPCPTVPDQPTPHICARPPLHDGPHMCYCGARQP